MMSKGGNSKASREMLMMDERFDTLSMEWDSANDAMQKE
jgi:hypothetical protein